jgi:protein-tyrosine-phosphatase
MVYPELQSLIATLESEFSLITAKRQTELIAFAQDMRASFSQFGRIDITVICTHNSRRSHLGQLWLKAAALFYGIKGVHTYSGGTEATAFNHRMVLAVKRCGFRVNQLDTNENPKFYIPLSDDDYSLDIHYSKRYDESYNPQKQYIALMVCSQADEACPVVTGAFKRVSLPYEDPKDSDDSPLEAQVYEQKVHEIGREMLFAMQQLKLLF